MIKIHPKVEYKISCPVCDRLMKNRGLILNGIRCLVEGWCSGCQRKFLADLPTGQAIYTPLILDVQAKKVYGKEKPEWFANPLKDGFNHQDSRSIKIRKRVYKKVDSLVLINCLDYLYGHCLLKLLNTQRYLEKDLNCWVIVPKILSHLVPRGVAQVWEVDLPLAQMKNWLVDLNKKVQKEIQSKREVYLAELVSHPNYKSFDINKFIKPKGFLRRKYKKPVIVFAYREDRCWGGDVKSQRKKIIKVYNILKRHFPDLTFGLYGAGQHRIEFPKEIVDFRMARYSLASERRSLNLLIQTDCVIGVHGSSMLLPSALAQATIELLPPSRWGNILQDYIPPHKSADSIESLFGMRVLYGNEKLSDIKPELVSDMAIHLIDYRGQFFSKMYPSIER